MFKNIIIAGAITLCFSAANIAIAQEADVTKPEVRLSKKERKALMAKQAKLAKVGSMCRAAVMFSLEDPFSAKENPEYQAADAFWTPYVDAYMANFEKPKKRNKMRSQLVSSGSNAIKGMGNGDLFAGARAAKQVCSMMKSENLEGPTSELILSQ